MDATFKFFWRLVFQYRPFEIFERIYEPVREKTNNLHGRKREADQRLCFRYTDSTFPPLLIPKFSRFWVSSVTVQAGLCWTWSETQIVGFVMHRLIFCFLSVVKYTSGSYSDRIA